MITTSALLSELIKPATSKQKFRRRPLKKMEKQLNRYAKRFIK